MTNSKVELEHIHLMDVQKAEMERSLWIESEKAHRDLSRDNQGRPSDTFMLRWIGQYGKDFRETWNKSCCKSCQCYNCKDGPKQTCADHVNNLRLMVIKQDSKLIDFEVINIDTHEIVGRYYLVIQKHADEVIPSFLKHSVKETFLDKMFKMFRFNVRKKVRCIDAWIA